MPLRLPSADTIFGDRQPLRVGGRLASFDTTGYGTGQLAEGLGEQKGLEGKAAGQRLEAQAAGLKGKAAGIEGEAAGVGAQIGRSQAEIAGAEANVGRIRAGIAGTEAQTAGSLAKSYETQADTERRTGESEIAVGKAVQGLGASAFSAAMHYEAKQTALETARADALRLTSGAKLKSDLGDDQEADGMADRYTKRAEETLDQAASIISNPRERELYRLKHAPAAAQHGLDAQSRQASLYKDQELAADEQSLSNLRQTFLNENDPAMRAQVSEAVKGIYRGWVDKGYIKEQVAGEYERRWVEDTSVAKISTLSPAERMGALRGFEGALVGTESSGRASNVNSLGFAGLYQFGAPRLETIGAYTPGQNENMGGWSSSAKYAAGKWSGQFHIPGFDNIKTLQDFLNSPEAQRAAFQMHLAKMDEEIKANGFDKYEGKTVGGVRINRGALYGMMHLGGVGGARGFLTGESNAADANGTTMRDYAAKFSRTPVGSDLAQFVPADKATGLYERSRSELAAQADRADEGKRTEIATVKTLAKDDEASIMATGKPVDTLTGERVKLAMGPDAAASFEQNRAGAIKYYEATRNWDNVPLGQIDERLASLKPVAGQPGYENQQAFYNTAAARAIEIQKERRVDPAAAADRTPEVAALKQGADLDKPESYRALVKAREAAQEKLGIPEDLRSPITKDEARRLWAPLEQAAADPREQKAVLDDTVKQIVDAYGEDHATQVISAVLKEGRAKAETAKAAAGILRKLSRGDQPTVTDVRTMGDAAKTDAMQGAVHPIIGPSPSEYGMPAALPNPEQGPPMPRWPVPLDKDIRDLRARPELAPTFEKHFGPGSAAAVIGNVQTQAAAKPAPKAAEKPAEAPKPEPKPEPRKKVTRLLKDENGEIVGLEETTD